MANFNFNKAILGGRLTRDPELRTTSNGTSVVSFSVAITRRYNGSSGDGQPQTDFINCVAWRNTAEFVSKYFRKGSSICVEGEIQTRTWDDKDGQKRYATEVIVSNAYFVDSKSENPAGGAYAGEGFTAPSFSSAPAEAPKFEEVSNDDDLPF